MRVPLLVLNYNGRKLLEECLPSLVAAAAASRHDCRVVVIDNSSTDDSLAYLAEGWPEIEIIRRPNAGLCSYNTVLAELNEPVAVLLNNDVKLAVDCVDRLIEPLLCEYGSPVSRGVYPRARAPKNAHAVAESRSACALEEMARARAIPSAGINPAAHGEHATCWMTSALCWRFDGETYDGQKTAVRWRHGLVQATSMFPGHERGIYTPGWTASAGAAMAVNRWIFLKLGGFDPLFLPGRLEDLDLSFRAWLAGYHARHVPTAVALHLGMGSFSRAFDAAACDELTLRNTLLFQWKNLRHPAHRLRQAIGLPLRLLRELLRAPFAASASRWMLCRALRGAWQRRRQLWKHSTPGGTTAVERAFFKRYAPAKMAHDSMEQAARVLQVPRAACPPGGQLVATATGGQAARGTSLASDASIDARTLETHRSQVA